MIPLGAAPAHRRLRRLIALDLAAHWRGRGGTLRPTKQVVAVLEGED